MQFFRNLSVRMKLFGGFRAVLLVAAVTGVVLIIQIGSVDSGGVYLEENALPSVHMIARIRHAVVDVRRAQARFVLKPRGATAARQKGDWTADAAEISAALQKYQASFTNATDRKLWQSVKEQWAAYSQQTAPIEALALQSQAAGLKLIDSSSPAFQKLDNTNTTWMNDLRGVLNPPAPSLAAVA